MLCITARKYVTLIVSKIFLAKHLLFFLLCKICLLFPNEGHQTHIPQRTITPDFIGGGCFYNKFSTDLMFLKLLASKQRAFSPSASRAASAGRAFSEPEGCSSQIAPLPHQGQLTEHQIPPDTIPHP